MLVFGDEALLSDDDEHVLRHSSSWELDWVRMGKGEGIGVGSGEGSSLMGDKHLPNAKVGT